MDVVLEILIQLVQMAILFGMAGLAVSWALLKNHNPRFAVLAGAVTVALYMGALFTLAVSTQKQDVVAGLQNSFDQVWKIKAQSMADLKATPAEIENEQRIFQKYVFLALPAWMAVTCLTLGLLAYYLVSFFLARITQRVAGPIPFRGWVVPEYLVFGLIVGGMLKVMSKENSLVDIVGNNFLVFFGCLYTLGGLSIVSFFLKKWFLSPGLRTLSYVVIFSYIVTLQQLFNPICLIGILDVWFDFRRLNAPPPEPAT